jgi:AraC-like DNA-binding protein
MDAAGIAPAVDGLELGAAPRRAEAPSLACVGDYREFAPAPPLREHFSCVWAHAIPLWDAGSVAVVPDGCVDLVWIDGRLTVAGPDVTVAVSRFTPGTTIVGIRFRPGSAAKWLGLPMSELVGRRVELGDIWGRRARELGGWMGDAAAPTEARRRLEAGLGAMASDMKGPALDMAFLFGALGSPDAPPHSFVSLRRQLDISERSLRRRSTEAFGYGPKTLDRILRFQRFLGLARQGREPRLWELAYGAGYADQAHLSREVRRLSGLTPAEVVRQLAA